MGGGKPEGKSVSLGLSVTVSQIALEGNGDIRLEGPSMPK